MSKPPILRDVVKNFKAIRESGRLKLTPLTVLIGNNGSGKSSLIEALEHPLIRHMLAGRA